MTNLSQATSLGRRLSHCPSFRWALGMSNTEGWTVVSTSPLMFSGRYEGNLITCFPEELDECIPDLSNEKTFGILSQVFPTSIANAEELVLAYEDLAKKTGWVKATSPILERWSGRDIEISMTPGEIWQVKVLSVNEETFTIKDKDFEGNDREVTLSRSKWNARQQKAHNV